MVTVAILLVTIFLLILIIGIDMFLFQTSLTTTVVMLFDIHMGLGKKYLMFAIFIAFISALIVDFRRKKLSKEGTS